jgi:hypothetical protein
MFSVLISVYTLFISQWQKSIHFKGTVSLNVDTINIRNTTPTAGMLATAKMLATAGTPAKAGVQAKARNASNSSDSTKSGKERMPTTAGTSATTGTSETATVLTTPRMTSTGGRQLPLRRWENQGSQRLQGCQPHQGRQ